MTTYTDAGAAYDFAVFGTNHQVGPQYFVDLLGDHLLFQRDDALVLAANECFVVRIRDNASVAGTNVSINLQWIEV